MEIYAKSDGTTLKEHVESCLNELYYLKDAARTSTDEILKKDEFWEDLIISTILHDLGKIEPTFQRRMRKLLKVNDEDVSKNYSELVKVLKEEDLWNDILDHELFSAIWVNFLDISVNGIKLSEDRVNNIKTAILLHHYNRLYESDEPFTNLIGSMRYIKSYIEVIIKDNFDEIKKELISYWLNLVKNRFSVDICITLDKEKVERWITYIDKYSEFRLAILDKIIPNVLSQFRNDDVKCKELLLLIGFLRKVDHRGSIDIENVGELETLENVDRVLRDLKSKIDERAKNERWSRWQQKIIDANRENLNRLVIVAPTGSGKTELAFLWTAATSRKLIYTLPLRVALSDIFDRRLLRGYLKEYRDKNIAASILHSTALSELAKYVGDIKNLKDANDVLHDYRQSRELSYPIMLTTVDQIMLSGLRYYGYEKTLATATYSSIVIDELQAYNPEMTAIILKTIEKMVKFGANILVITATLNELYRGELERMGFTIVDLYEDEELSNLGIDKTDIKNLTLKRHKIDVIEIDIKGDKRKKLKEKIIKEIIVRSIKEHNVKSVGVILNTVNDAIDVYKSLKNEFGDNNVILLHSRLINAVKKSRVEKARKAIENREMKIVIATQIIEASVDLDFDLMITAPAPADSIIQRMGRVYRNRPEKGENSKEFSGNYPNVIILDYSLCLDGKLLDHIYDLEFVRNSIREFKKAKGKILCSKDEEEILKKAFGTVRNKFQVELNKMKDYINTVSFSKKSDAQRLFRNITTCDILLKSEKPKFFERLENEIFEKSLVDKFRNFICSLDVQSRDLDYESKLERIRLLSEFSVPVSYYTFEKLNKIAKLRKLDGSYSFLLDLDTLNITDSDIQDVIDCGIEVIKEKLEMKPDAEEWIL